MDDVCSAHGARVRNSNAEFLDRAKAARDIADAAIRASIVRFGARHVEIAREADNARADFSSEIDAILGQALATLEAVAYDNEAALALSTGALQSEFAARTTYLTTGRLPAPAASPAKIGEDVVFRDSDPPSAELTIFPSPRHEVVATVEAEPQAERRAAE